MSYPLTLSGETEAPEWRYERKFLVSDLEPEALGALLRLHPAGFRNLHPARWVNSLYLDTIDRRSRRETRDGVAQRAKVRLRWYGDLFGRIEAPSLEVKQRRGPVGTKQVHPATAFTIERGVRLGAVLAPALRALPENARVWAAGLEPSLLNRYRRRYLAARDGKLRLTVDTRLEALTAAPGVCAFRQRFRDPVCIVELKYGVEAEDAARHIAARFPFRMTRSSKYVRGLEGLATGAAQ